MDCMNWSVLKTHICIISFLYLTKGDSCVVVVRSPDSLSRPVA